MSSNPYTPHGDTIPRPLSTIPVGVGPIKMAMSTAINRLKVIYDFLDAHHNFFDRLAKTGGWRTADGGRLIRTISYQVDDWSAPYPTLIFEPTVGNSFELLAECKLQFGELIPEGFMRVDSPEPGFYDWSAIVIPQGDPGFCFSFLIKAREGLMDHNLGTRPGESLYASVQKNTLES